MLKREFLAVYDYGQGGIWFVIRARSAKEIEQKFPDLSVVDRRPAWMDDIVFSRIREKMSADIDEDMSPVFSGLRRARRHASGES